jgi:hypothetical protein
MPVSRATTWAKPRRKKPTPNVGLPQVSIVQAMDDPSLFGGSFQGPSWDAWRAILKAAYALPMTAEEVEFFRSVTDRDPPKKRVRELWLIIGRRGGKDSIASLILAYTAAWFSGQDKLRPGERALCACLATDRDQAAIVLDYARGYFDDVAALKPLVQDDERASDIELTNRCDISVMTSNFRAVRGRPVLLAIFDELALWRDEKSANPDEEIYRSIVPGTLTLAPEALIVGISSPYRKNGLLYAKFKQHYGQDDDDILVVRAPTRTFNPLIPQSVIDAEIARDPAAMRAEYLAEFRSDVGGWMLAEIIESAVDAGVRVRPPAAGVKYVAFADPSGGARDSFTLAIAHLDDENVVLDCLHEIKAPFDPSVATFEMSAILKQYGLTSVTGDKYGAQWVVAAFAAHGIQYRHSKRDRSEIYLDVMPQFTSGRARLLDHPKMVGQFCSLERTTAPSGRDKVDHGKGGHDDLCNAVAGALVLAAVVKKSVPLVGPYVVSAVREFGSNTRPQIYEIGGTAVPQARQPDPSATPEALEKLCAEWRQLHGAKLSGHCPDPLRLDLLPGLIRKMAGDLGVEMPHLEVSAEARRALGPVPFHDPACTATTVPPSGLPNPENAIRRGEPVAAPVEIAKPFRLSELGSTWKK